MFISLLVSDRDLMVENLLAGEPVLSDDAKNTRHRAKVFLLLGNLPVPVHYAGVSIDSVHEERIVRVAGNGLELVLFRDF